MTVSEQHARPDAIVALGLVEREDGAYRNGAAADAFLSGRGAVNLSPALRFMNAIAYPVWEGLERAVRTDRAWPRDSPRAVVSASARWLSGGLAGSRSRRCRQERAVDGL